MTSHHDSHAAIVAHLERDAAFFDAMADNLEVLIPRFSDEQQKAWARSEVASRRAKANELRSVIERMRSR